MLEKYKLGVLQHVSIGGMVSKEWIINLVMAVCGNDKVGSQILQFMVMRHIGYDFADF